MKIKNLFLVALSTIVFMACSNDEDQAPQKDIRSVSVSLSGLSTKASAPGNVLTSDTMNVKNVLIKLTNASGAVIASKSVTKDAVLDSDWDKLTDPTKGLKFINTSESISKVYVYGNAGTAVSSTNVVTTDISQQQGSQVLYSGVDEDLTPVVTEPINPDPTNGQTYTANVTIVPIVARLQVNKISFKNAGSFVYTREINNQTKSATVAWTGFTGELKGIYANNIYVTYNNPGTLVGLLSNLTYVNNIQQGQWLFTAPSPVMNAASFASYNNYDTETSTYVTLPLETSGKCYAFNFFPGFEVPRLHLDLANIAVTGLTSTDTEVFNPALIGATTRFANIVKFYKNVNTEMVAADFKAGTLYNMEIELIPSLDTDLQNMQYNVLVHVTIAPWVEEMITPGFNLNE